MPFLLYIDQIQHWTILCDEFETVSRTLKRNFFHDADVPAKWECGAPALVATYLDQISLTLTRVIQAREKFENGYRTERPAVAGPTPQQIAPVPLRYGAVLDVAKNVSVEDG